MELGTHRSSKTSEHKESKDDDGGAARSSSLERACNDLQRSHDSILDYISQQLGTEDAATTVPEGCGTDNDEAARLVREALQSAAAAKKSEQCKDEGSGGESAAAKLAESAAESVLVPDLRSRAGDLLTTAAKDVISQGHSEREDLLIAQALLRDGSNRAANRGEKSLALETDKKKESVTSDEALEKLDPKGRRKVEKALAKMEWARDRSSNDDASVNATPGDTLHALVGPLSTTTCDAANAAMKPSPSSATLATKSLSSGSSGSGNESPLQCNLRGNELIVRKCPVSPPPPPPRKVESSKPVALHLVRSSSAGNLSKMKASEQQTQNQKQNQKGAANASPKARPSSPFSLRLARKSNPPPPPPRRGPGRSSLPDLSGAANSVAAPSAILSANASSGPAIVPSDAIVVYSDKPLPSTNAKEDSPRRIAKGTRKLLGRGVRKTEVHPEPSEDNSPKPNNSGSAKHRLARADQVARHMNYTDPFGDAGIYTGEIDDECRPHGKGTMKYHNGIFYEGKWIHGTKDDGRGQKGTDAYSSVTRERILGGFTSWKGQRKGPKDGSNDRGRVVYGMDWADLKGYAGKYTGRVDENDNPDGRGVMRYDFGLVAEGEWLKGVLNDGGGGNPVGAMSVAGGGMSIAPGMSVGGAASVVSGLGMVSVCGVGYPMPYYNMNAHAAPVYYNPAPQYAMMACPQPGPPSNISDQKR